MVDARIKMNDYTNKVLNVIKAQFDLNDKSEALDKFAEICGESFVEKEPKDKYVQKIIETAELHLKHNKKRRMTMKELDELSEA